MKALTLNTRVGELAAHLYLPAGVTKPPVVIVTGAWTTVKEQMPATYAKALAKEGYAALTFDFRGWGQSASELKYLENPHRKTDDIRAVIEAVAELEDVDGNRIAGLGICASAGYMLDAASGNSKVKAAAVVAPWLHDSALVNAIYGGEESVKSLIEAGERAANADVPVYIEAASTTNSDSLMYQAPYYTETDRGLIPEFDNKFNLASWKAWLTYDAQAGAKAQDKPVLMVASQAMALPAGAQQYLDNAGVNVEVTWLDDVTQFDFYDVPQHVAKATSLVAGHFDSKL
ncbi:alpha/beta hydrolase [Corallincola platygyrae]|uniref:Alpha/beta hydrolase n=1 Tax=Corallincola platygyrae TaxID=1193278 RepID=A0ABW4XIW0_9GAMM